MVLTGDLHEATAGIRWARETFPDKPIVYVAGNHEFYGHHWVVLLDQWQKAALKFDMHYLEASGVDIGGEYVSSAAPCGRTSACSGRTSKNW